MFSSAVRCIVFDADSDVAWSGDESGKLRIVRYDEASGRLDLSASLVTSSEVQHRLDGTGVARYGVLLSRGDRSQLLAIAHTSMLHFTFVGLCGAQLRRPTPSCLLMLLADPPKCSNTCMVDGLFHAW